MSDPSFWVSHGALVWQSVLGAALGAGALAAWKVAPRAMRARARRVREELGAAQPEPLAKDAGALVTIAGTLVAITEEAPRRAAVTVVPRGHEAAEEPTPKAKSAVVRGARLAVEAGGQRVAIDGDVQVLVGTEETEGCIGRGPGQPMLWDFAGELGALPSAFAVRALAPGDRVIARGVLRHDPPADGRYREGAGTYALTPIDEEGGARCVRLVAAAAPRPLGRTRAKTALRALVGPLAALGVLTAVGEATVRMPWKGAWAVASTTPFRRADALEKLRGAVRLSSHATPESIDRAVALDQLRGRCADAVDDAFDHHRVLESIDMAAACKDPARQARGRFARFELEQAAPLYEAARARAPWAPYSLSEATTYLATGRMRAAAEAMRALDRQSDEERSAHDALTCGALWADAAAGDASAAEKLDKKLGDGTAVCRLLALDAARGLVKGGYYAYYGGRELTDLTTTAAAIGSERGESLDNGPMTSMCWHGPGAMVFDPRQCVFTVPPGVAASAAAALERDGRPRATYRAALLVEGLARLDSFIGEIDDARARVAQARALVDRTIDTPAETTSGDAEEYSWNPRMTDAAAKGAARRQRAALLEYDWILDVRAGKASEPPSSLWLADREVLDAARRARAKGDADAVDRLAERDLRDWNRKLWLHARADDGPGLAARLEERESDGRGVVDFAGGRPALRPELDRWVRWSYPTECASCGVYPLLNAIASRRDAAVAIGATDLAGDLGAVARRGRALLLRRDIAVVLAVISEMAPP